MAWGALILLGLEVWRPFFFLTDDNLVGTLPVLASVGRSLARGESPFWISTLFGGYDLLRDPSALCLWNPLTMMLALLTQTPARLAVIDISVGAHLLLAAFCCAHLLALWRRRFGLALSDRRLIFVSVSYAFSAYSIIVCASWSTFAANIAAAPLALLGMFHAQRLKGVGLVLCSFLLSILDGHLSPLAWSWASLSLFAVLWPLASPLCGRDPGDISAASTWGAREAGAVAWEVPLRWAGGNFLGLALCSPLLWLGASGFAHTARDSSFAASEVLRMSVPAPTLALSWLAGSLSALASDDPLQLVQLSPGASGAIASAAASHFVLLSLLASMARAKASAKASAQASARRIRRVDAVFAILIVGVVLIVARPEWIARIVGALPLLRSLRFPFREVWLLGLWTHLWMAWRGGFLTQRAARLSAVSGSLVLAASLLAWGPPTFSRIGATREWVVSGRAEKFWEWARPRLPPGSRLLPVATPEQWRQADRLPLPLLCAFNFPALFDVPALRGYVIKGMERGRMQRGQVGGPAGLYSEQEGQAALRRDPKIVLARIESLRPLAVRFEGRGFVLTVRPEKIAP